MQLRKRLVQFLDFGCVAILWDTDSRADMIVGIQLLSQRSIMEEVSTGTCPRIDEIAQQIERYLQGQPLKFKLDYLRLSTLTVFQRSVLLTTNRIPYGTVSSYGDIADAVQSPRAARAVGNALGSNPFPILIPCHRVIRGDGSLGGFTSGPSIKRKLLAIEGLI